MFKKQFGSNFKAQARKGFVLYNNQQYDNISFYILNNEIVFETKTKQKFFKCIYYLHKMFKNGLHYIDFFKNQISGALKDIYVLSNYACYNHNMGEKIPW